MSANLYGNYIELCGRMLLEDQARSGSVKLILVRHSSDQRSSIAATESFQDQQNRCSIEVTLSINNLQFTSINYMNARPRWQTP